MSPNVQLVSRLKFLRLDTTAIATLHKMSATVQEILPGVLEQFYTHVAQHPEVAQFFDSSDRIKFAANRQTEHWKMILKGTFSEDYISSVQQIGSVHARIGLEPQYYLAGYTYLIDETMKLVMKKLSDRKGLSTKNIEEFTKFQSAFLRAAMLDMDLAIYFFNETRKKEAQQKILDMADHFEKEVLGISEIVSSASYELEASARSMTEIAERTFKGSADASSSILQASNGVEHAAISADELGKAVAEISERTAQAHEMSAQSSGTANDASETIQRLSTSADKVSEVVSLISDIAAQTNLLALNATIESARAGEAGKGFAVVASEVKALANETAKATEEITVHIQEMLETTNRAVQAISAIQASVTEMNSVSLSINAAIEEQTSSTREIARNTHEAAQGAKAVGEAITEVASSAERTKDVSAEVVTASSELGQQATVLRTQVQDFLQYIRAS
ncbi:globin-coupled sensor protein [Ponticaulis sp.]|uniref:globin-coupled sensor protein n=1 Tax=Ponticaulis sp. TaxID=2020902 RepID=UPI0025D8EBDE|nr:globin-coupled sensor protein [Ponticaulis sp.]|tara:strand:+ start:5635 stop:6987 length:1353 start_codon:yes stop_codon:yes gene_type:complete